MDKLDQWLKWIYSRSRTGGYEPKDYYVYAWYRIGENIPYYIGSGVKPKRFYEFHAGGHECWHRTLMGGPCEVERGTHPTIEVVLIDGLTEENARLIESVLIQTLKPSLVNSNPGPTKFWE